MGLAQTSSLRIIEAGPGNLDPKWLVPSIAAGDEPAVARFYDATSGLLFGLLLLILGDTTMAEEVLSEVYAEVRQHAALFDRNDENLLTWLVTIAHRRALEHLCSSSEDRQFAVSVGLASSPDTGPSRRFGISKSAHRKLVGATLDAISPAEQKMIRVGQLLPNDSARNRDETTTIARFCKNRPAVWNLAAFINCSRIRVFSVRLKMARTVSGNGAVRGLQPNALFSCSHDLDLL